MMHRSLTYKMFRDFLSPMCLKPNAVQVLWEEFSLFCLVLGRMTRKHLCIHVRSVQCSFFTYIFVYCVWGGWYTWVGLREPCPCGEPRLTLGIFTLYMEAGSFDLNPEHISLIALASQLAPERSPDSMSNVLDIRLAFMCWVSILWAIFPALFFLFCFVLL